MNPHLMNELANSPVFWLSLICGLLALYVLPSVIAAIRGVEGLGWVIVVNLVPTGIGWPAALLLAIALPRRSPRQHSLQRPAPGHGYPFPADLPEPAETLVIKPGTKVISGSRYRVMQ
jgi:Superinfection immunity protein